MTTWRSAFWSPLSCSGTTVGDRTDAPRHNIGLELSQAAVWECRLVWGGQDGLVLNRLRNSTRR